MLNLTDEQKAIVEFVRTRNDSLLIEALAGTGKTSTVVESLKAIPQRSILVCAFNKRIATELQSKIPPMPKTHGVHVKTFHAIGLSILKKHHPKLASNVDASSTEKLVTRAAEAFDQKLPYPSRRASIRMLRYIKESIAPRTTRVDTISTGGLRTLGQEQGFFGKMNDLQIERVIQIVQSAYEIGVCVDKIDSIDFCDMVWLPLALDLAPPSRYQAIVVDEYQDLSEPQFELLTRLRAPGSGRMIFVGDARQAIYQFRGAVGGDVRAKLINDYQAQTLPLTTSFRCSKAVVREAQSLVPELRQWDQAYDGAVSNIPLHEMPRWFVGGLSDEAHTFVLSRTNADLLDVALYLWREGVGFQLNAGQDLLEPLFELLESLGASSGIDTASFEKKLDAWLAVEAAKADKIDATAWRERVEEQHAMLTRALLYAKPSGIAGLLRSILQPGQTGVLLSTVHKVKGLEADRVFLLEQTFVHAGLVEAFTQGAARPVGQASSPVDALDQIIDRMTANLTPRERQILQTRLSRSTSPTYAVTSVDLINDQTYQAIRFKATEEFNITYVAITRAREHLIWVDLDARDANQPAERENARWYFYQTAKRELAVTSKRPLASLSIEQIEDLWSELERECQRLERVGKPRESDAVAKYAAALKDHYDQLRAMDE